MNKSILVAVLLLAGLSVGFFLGRAGQPSSELASDGSEILYWVAPMDPDFRRDEPGKSPMGMDLVPVYGDGRSESDPAVVETVGYVSYDEDTLKHIHTRVDGWIETLAVKATGDPVEQGQLLFELYSPTLVNAQEEYLAALGSQNARLRSASRERLRALGITERDIVRLENERTVSQYVRVFAEQDGYVTGLGVREGIFVTPSTDVMSIAAIEQVWVLVEVFERQAAWIEAGQQSEVELDYLPGQSWQGTVDYVYPELDPRTRTLRVRLKFDNSSRALRPNMFGRITIFGSATDPVVHVPREALIRGGAIDRVVVALGGGQFRAQPVDVGIESGDRVEIRSGLDAGDLIVTSGQFLIDSESNIESALTRMDKNASVSRPSRVQIGAVVRGANSADAKITLQHDAVPEWSWPAMTMLFDVEDAALVEGLQDGQPVDVVIEKYADGRHRITEILPGSMSPESMEAAPEPMDHSGHDMGQPEPELMDDSGHDMETEE
jgi:Cu(I)/Ag(I) efflux system membrane fusion protein